MRLLLVILGIMLCVRLFVCWITGCPGAGR